MNKPYLLKLLTRFSRKIYKMNKNFSLTYYIRNFYDKFTTQIEGNG